MIKTVKDIQKHYLTNIKTIMEPLVNHYKKKAITANNEGNTDQAKMYDKYANKIKYTAEFCKASKAKSLMPLITSEFYDSKFITKLNNRKDVLPVKKGIISLKSGDFIERTKYDFFSFELPIKWKGLDYDTELIERFMDDIMLCDKDMVRYLQKLLGYSITGYIKEQKFVILWGTGGNGKSLLQDILKELMVEYYRQCTSDIVIQGKKSNVGSASPHIMQLMGARLAFVDESKKGAKLNEEIVKSVTGCSSITSRPLFKDLITFEPTFQLFLLTNYKPEINVSPSLERRLVLIPFLAEFKDEDKYDENNDKHKLKDVNIEDLLKTNLDKLLVWLVNGSVKYFEDGLGSMPNLAKKATKDYFNDNDNIKNMIDEYCDKDESGFVYHKDLYYIYTRDYGIISKMSFTNMMKNYGYIIKKKKQGNGFIGLKIKESSDDDNSSNLNLSD